MSFSKEVEAATKKANAKLEKVANDTFKRLGTLLVERTPIGDVTLWSRNPPEGYRPGTMVNSWFAGYGSPANESQREPNTNGATSLANINLVSKDAAGQVAYIINPTPYANRIEYDTWSTQAPAGIVRRTAAEFAHIVRVTVNGIK